MKIILSNPRKENLRVFFQRFGYHLLKLEPNGQLNFVKRLGSSFYPRFHIYLREGKERLIANLHLDQKKASYKGQKAHSGEYQDTEILKQEAKALKEYFKSYD